MKVWLTRQANGSYLLSALRPKQARVGKTDRTDAYIRAGDPLGYRHCCEDSIHLLFGVELEPLESRRVEITGRLL